MTDVLSVEDAAVVLADIVGVQYCLTGADAEPYATDVYRTLSAPLAVVRPSTLVQIQKIVETTSRLGVDLSVRGGGASYTDGYLCSKPGQVVLDLSRFDQIEMIDQVNGYVTVQAGVTWAALKSALDALGLRTPFWGPFSGLAATVGGSVSQNSISHGSGAYGISAASVQALEVVTASGAVLKTGSSVAGGLPFSRNFGPDLTGLFTGDCGTLGVKTKITLPLIKKRRAHRPISFAFATFQGMHESMRLVAQERLEDSHFALDAALSQGQIARQDQAGATPALALSILRSSPSLLSGLRRLASSALFARKALTQSNFMTHYIVEGLNDAEVRARLDQIRELVAGLGREIPAVVPAVVRDMPFAPLYNVLGPSGERWVPLHGILPHSAVQEFHDSLTRFYAVRADEMKRLGVWTGGMYGTVESSAFLYEIAIYWPDAISPYHRSVLPREYLSQLTAYADNPSARSYVHQLKEELIELFVEHGAVNFQIGKAYPFRSRLEGEPRRLLDAVKAHMDPAKRLSPGSLER